MKKIICIAILALMVLILPISTVSADGSYYSASQGSPAYDTYSGDASSSQDGAGSGWSGNYYNGCPGWSGSWGHRGGRCC